MRARLEIAAAHLCQRWQLLKTLRLACPHHEEAVYALAQVATLGMRRSALRKTCEKPIVCAHDWKSLPRTVPEVATSTILRLA